MTVYELISALSSAEGSYNKVKLVKRTGNEEFPLYEELGDFYVTVDNDEVYIVLEGRNENS